MTTIDYGTDADWTSDAASPTMPWLTGILVVGQCLARLLMIPTDSIEYLPNTVDLRSFVEGHASDSEIIHAVERVVRADERVEQSQVSVSRVDGVVTVTIVVLTGEGAFTLVLSATDAAVSLVSLQEAS